jgi:hypothetical protein
MARAGTSRGDAPDDQELNERIAFLHKFKRALQRQRERFQAYLDLLERGESAGGSPDEALEFHVALEEAVVRDIAVFEQSIRPLEAIYEARRPDDDQSSEIPQIRAALAHTREELVARTRVSRAELRRQIEQLTGVDEPIRSRRPVGYRRPSPGVGSAKLVDVNA